MREQKGMKEESGKQKNPPSKTGQGSRSLSVFAYQYTKTEINDYNR